MVRLTDLQYSTDGITYVVVPGITDGVRIPSLTTTVEWVRWEWAPFNPIPVHGLIDPGTFEADIRYLRDDAVHDSLRALVGSMIYVRVTWCEFGSFYRKTLRGVLWRFDPADSNLGGYDGQLVVRCSGAPICE